MAEAEIGDKLKSKVKKTHLFRSNLFIHIFHLQDFSVWAEGKDGKTKRFSFGLRLALAGIKTAMDVEDPRYRDHVGILLRNKNSEAICLRYGVCVLRNGPDQEQADPSKSAFSSAGSPSSQVLPNSSQTRDSSNQIIPGDSGINDNRIKPKERFWNSMEAKAGVIEVGRQLSKSSFSLV